MRSANPERVIVFGAGAVGASVGALLFETGVQCLLVARNEHGRAVARHGVTLQFPGEQRSVRVPTVGALAEAIPTRHDLVILATMGHDTKAALSELDSDVPVASFQNGLAPLAAIAQRASRPTLAAVVFMPAERRAPGVIALSAAPVVGSVLIGDWPRGACTWASWLAARLRMARFRAEAEPDIAPWVRAKLLLNLGGIVAALCDAPLRDVVEAAQAEARAVWRAAGDPFEEVSALMARIGPLELTAVDGRLRIGGSTRAALARGDRLETRFLHKPIIDVGKAVGVATPVNEALVQLAEQAELQRWIPGCMNAHALRQRVRVPSKNLTE